MRRRQAFAAQTAAREAALASANQMKAPAVPLTVGTPAKPEKVYWEAIGEPTAWPQANPNACPKCGRVVTRGKFMHQKHCKGAT